MKVNSEKTKEMVIMPSRKSKDVPAVTIDGKAIERTETFKLLGVLLSDNLNWGPHVEYLLSKCSQRIYLLVLQKRAGVADRDILNIFTAMIRSVVEYACPVWHTSLTKEQSSQLESVQRRALQVVYPDLSYRRALQAAELQTLHQRREDMSRAYFQEMMKPSHKLNYLLPGPRRVGYNLRLKAQYGRLYCQTKRFQKTLVPHGLINWQ